MTSPVPVQYATLTQGDALIATLSQLCSEWGLQDGRLSIRGSLSAASVRPTAESAAVALEGDLQCVQMEAWLIGGDLAAQGVIAWGGPGVPGCLGGLVDEAICDAVQVVIQPWAPAGAALPPADRRAMPPTSTPSRTQTPKARPAKAERSPVVDLSEEMEALPTPAKAPTKAAPKPPAPKPATSTAAAPAAQGGWGAAVAASKAPKAASSRRKPKAQGVDPVGASGDDLKVGDLILHPRFGRCRVARPADRGKVKVRLPAGRLTDLHLKVVRLIRQADEDGHRVFKVLISRQS